MKVDAKKEKPKSPGLPELTARDWRLIFLVVNGLLVFLCSVALGMGAFRGAANVRGKVTYEGRPILWGRITFVSLTGKRMTHSSHIRMGEYDIRGVPIGPVKISVETMEARKAVGQPPIMGLSKGFKAPPLDRDVPPPEAVGKDKFIPIPLDYSNSETSGLSYTVHRGDNVHDIALAFR